MSVPDPILKSHTEALMGVAASVRTGGWLFKIPQNIILESIMRFVSFRSLLSL